MTPFDELYEEHVILRKELEREELTEEQCQRIRVFLRGPYQIKSRRLLCRYQRKQSDIIYRFWNELLHRYSQEEE